MQRDVCACVCDAAMCARASAMLGGWLLTWLMHPQRVNRDVSLHNDPLANETAAQEPLIRCDTLPQSLNPKP